MHICLRQVLNTQDEITLQNGKLSVNQYDTVTT